MAYQPGMAVLTAALITFGLANIPAATAQVKDDGAAEVPAKKDKRMAGKITDRSHPDYIRCRSEPVIGSLVRKKKICMTNSEWKEYARAGNEGSRSLLDDIMKGGMRQD